MVQRIVLCVQDSMYGRPAIGVPVRLERATVTGRAVLLNGATDDAGRWSVEFEPSRAAGSYRLAVEPGCYFNAIGARALVAEIVIAVSGHRDGAAHRLTLTLAPCGHALFLAG